MRRLTLIAIPYLWLLALFLVPVSDRDENFAVRICTLNSPL